jgi:energy-coupling factor transporter ATP-binding protein EcfA2
VLDPTYPVPAKAWLDTAVADYENTVDFVIRAPLNYKGNPYTSNGLYDEQQRAMYPIMSKIREWLTCDDLTKFEPYFCTLVGKGGTGKSTVLNTVTAILRTKFQYNNVVVALGPTGTAAFNVGGETSQRFNGQGIRGEYVPNSMNAKTRERLLQRCKHLLCLIIDERSLLSSKQLGITAQTVSETIFSGSMSNHVFGGIPVVILAGDDYQLPGTEEGALHAKARVGGSRMTQKGRSIFLRCAENVLLLQTNQRVNDSQQENKEMCERFRLGVNIQDKDVKKIQSLHLEAIRQTHGDDVVGRIEREAVYLFWTNEKRVRHNLIRLGETNSDENPTVIVKPIGRGVKYGTAISAHFQGKTPHAALLCVNAKVCVEGYNFQPLWGIHNGACGTVQEIVFAEHKDPNRGDHPEYVVVKFPQYIGPIWDTENPKVSTSTVFYT